jgi:hypothetical protein
MTIRQKAETIPRRTHTSKKCARRVYAQGSAMIMHGCTYEGTYMHRYTHTYLCVCVHIYACAKLQIHKHDLSRCLLTCRCRDTRSCITHTCCASCAFIHLFSDTHTYINIFTYIYKHICTIYMYVYIHIYICRMCTERERERHTHTYGIFRTIHKYTHVRLRMSNVYTITYQRTQSPLEGMSRLNDVQASTRTSEPYQEQGTKKQMTAHRHGRTYNEEHASPHTYEPCMCYIYMRVSAYVLCMLMYLTSSHSQTYLVDRVTCTGQCVHSCLRTCMHYVYECIMNMGKMSSRPATYSD